MRKIRKKDDAKAKVVDDEVETEKFISRLAIQRKLLHNLVDLASNLEPDKKEEAKKGKKITFSNRSNNN